MITMDKLGTISHKALALLLTVAMLCAMLPAAVMAAPGNPDVCECVPESNWLPRDYCAVGQAELKAELREIIASGGVVDTFEQSIANVANSNLINGLISGIVKRFLNAEILSSLTAPEIADIVSDYIYDTVSSMVDEMLEDMDLDLGDDEELIRGYIAAMVVEEVTNAIVAEIVTGALITDIIDESVKNITKALYEPVSKALFDALVDSYVEEIWNGGAPSTTAIFGHWSMGTQTWNSTTIGATMVYYLGRDFTYGLFAGTLSALLDKTDLDTVVWDNLSIEWVWGIIVETATKEAQSRIDALGLAERIAAELKKITDVYTGNECGVGQHQWRTITLLPSCTEAGSKKNICLVCMSVDKIEVLLPTGHKEVTTSAAPTCAEDGFITSTCSVCGAVISDYTLPALDNHRMSTPETTDATCTEVGYEDYSKCYDCDHYVGKILEMIEHDFVVDEEQYTEPTCTEDGYWALVCSVCGEVSENVEIDADTATGHDYEVTASEPATCAETGSKTYTCTVCGDSYTETLAIDPDNHVGETYENVIDPATYEANGLMGIYCAGCDELLRTEVIPMLVYGAADYSAVEAAIADAEALDRDHYEDFSGVDGAIAAVVYGKDSSEQAIVDGYAMAIRDAISALVPVAEAHEHDWSEWSVVTSATCEADGEETRVCTGDKDHGEHEETRAITALGHDWGEWMLTTPATADEDGEETRICANDESHTQTRPVPAIGPSHAWGEWSVVTPATCEASGEKARMCAGDVDHEEHGETELIPALGHAWGVWTITTLATADKTGEETRVCANDESHTDTRALYHVTVQTSYATLSGAGSYAAGAMVTIAAGVRSGYSFIKWTTLNEINIANTNSATTTFTMPAENVSVTAEWSFISTGGGGAPTGGGGAPPVITIPQTPVALSAWGLNPFVDVAEKAWYYDGVMYVHTKGLMYGTSTDPMKFSPEASLTRAMIATILYRVAGEPKIGDAPNPFVDVADDAWYVDTVRWAAANGVMVGYEDTKFAPDDALTKEQLAAVICRLLEATGLSLPKDEHAKKFTDLGNASDWAKQVVQTLAVLGVYNDIPGDTLNPQKPASRAEVACMLYRYLTMVDEVRTAADKSANTN